MDEYKPSEVESKWQKRWEDERMFSSTKESAGRKMYVLDMFPYPSGDGLHVGHIKIYTASDVVSRYLRMKGMNVLHPTGWDAFGLPTENTAIKKKVHPAELTKQNIDHFRKQMKRVGFSYDWDREVNTSDPNYYKWTQWIFLQLFAMGLAYEDTVPINWCPSCKTGLANEEVEGGKCERCGSEVEKKPIRQWMLKITKYADRLLQGIEGLEWPEFILDMQRNWIGRSEGSEVDFMVVNSKAKISVFTTRLDTLYGATYLVLAPEHPLLTEALAGKKEYLSVENIDEVQKYIEMVRHKTDMERQTEEKEKTGVELKGVVAVNPINGQKIPVWVADYVLMSYGTGSVMAVPAHDERDYKFAREYGLSIKQVIQPKIAQGSAELPYTGEGILIDSGNHSGIESVEAKKVLQQVLQLKGLSRKKVNYALRDWVFSRQRYWGEPIPIIHCEDCGAVPVPEGDLPVKLPEVSNYEPTGTGESPLAAIEDWVKVKCPNCPKMGRRETNTMPQWAGSSWYWLRYLDSHNKDELASREEVDIGLPGDLYVGGAEHAVLHLLYARFWNMVLYDQGVVSYEEPFLRFKSVGLLLGEDGQKMSKSKGNVVNPDEVISRVGADAMRVYVMFMGPFDHAMGWSETSLNGVSRFLNRVWRVVAEINPKVALSDSEEIRYLLHKTIKRVSEGTEQFRFNTAIAAMMEMLNGLEKASSEVSKETLEAYVLMLSPYAPHMAEELWARLGHSESLFSHTWPEFKADVLVKRMTTLPIQINGKVRGTVEVPTGANQGMAEGAALGVDNVSKYLRDRETVRVVYVEGKMLNFVVKDKE